MGNRCAALCLALCSAAAPAAAQIPPTPPGVSFLADAVAASGVTAHGKVAWFAVAREIEDSVATIVRRSEVVEDTDGDGQVRFELGGEVPWQSIWVAVDLTTGLWSVATPEEYPLRWMNGADTSVGEHTDGKPALGVSLHGYLDILVARPQVGAWTQTVGDGGAGDLDTLDGQVRVQPGQMVATAGTAAPAPESFVPGDLIVSIDPNNMEISIAQVPETESAQ
jgi:hypothetical protein